MFFPYRDDNPANTVPYVTIGLILLNILIFISMHAQGSDVYRFSIINYGLIPVELTHFQNIYPSVAISPVLSLITSLFVHGGILHLAGNMWFLWIFGDNVEDQLGHFRYFIFYIFAGIFASLLHVAFFPSSVAPVIGASGAISGVLGAYAVFFPYARIRTFIFIFFFFTTVMVPAVVFVGIWILFQALSGLLSLGTAGGGGVAWFAHLGGFLFGIYALRFFDGKKRLLRQED